MEQENGKRHHLTLIQSKSQKTQLTLTTKHSEQSNIIHYTIEYACTLYIVRPEGVNNVTSCRKGPATTHHIRFFREHSIFNGFQCHPLEWELDCRCFVLPEVKLVSNGLAQAKVSHLDMPIDGNPE